MAGNSLRLADQRQESMDRREVIPAGWVGKALKAEKILWADVV